MSDKNIQNIIDKSENILYSRIILKPNELYSNLESNIYKKLNEINVGKCNFYGFVKSIDNIIDKTDGKMVETDFSGNMFFDVWYSASISNPQVGDIIYGCKIIMVNEIGIFAEKEHFRIIITSKYLQPDFLQTFEKNSTINIVIIGKKYNINDSKITILGKIQYYRDINSEYPLLQKSIVFSKNNKASDWYYPALNIVLLDSISINDKITFSSKKEISYDFGYSQEMNFPCLQKNKFYFKKDYLYGFDPFILLKIKNKDSNQDEIKWVSSDSDDPITSIKDKKLIFNMDDHFKIDFYSNPLIKDNIYDSIFNKSDVYFHYKELNHHISGILQSKDEENNLLILGNKYYDLTQIGACFLNQEKIKFNNVSIGELSIKSHEKDISKNLKKLKNKNTKIFHIKNESNFRNQIINKSTFNLLHKKVNKNNKFNIISISRPYLDEEMWSNWPKDIPQYFKYDIPIESDKYLWNIINIINNYQEKNGTLIFNTKFIVDKSTIKIFKILTNYYERVFMTKPLSSSNLSSDLYIVALGYKTINDNDKNNIEKITEKWLVQPDSYVSEICDFTLNDQFTENILSYNKKMFKVYKEDITEFIKLAKIDVGIEDKEYPPFINFTKKDQNYFDDLLDKQKENFEKWINIITTKK